MTIGDHAAILGDFEHMAVALLTFLSVKIVVHSLQINCAPREREKEQQQREQERARAPRGKSVGQE
jgi:hypothetical protein